MKRRKPKRELTLDDIILDFAADVYAARQAKERALAKIRTMIRNQRPPSVN